MARITATGRTVIAFACKNPLSDGNMCCELTRTTQTGAQE